MGIGKKKKKHRLLWIILLVLLGIFAIYLFWPEDDYEYDDYYEKGYEDSYGTNNSGATSVNAGGTVTRDQISDIVDCSAVRPPMVELKGNGEDTVTVLMYVNGSNLESDDGEATTDLSEIIKGAGTSDKVNIIVQTMGTKSWKSTLGVSSDRTQRFYLDGRGLTLLKDDLGQLDCTKTNTLSDFIKWGAANFPADRYILLFWDHGAGSVYGFGYDEWVSDENASLTIDEIQDALKDAGVYFDFIGMDCCIMSTLETCVALYDFCDYTILSEDFESGLGWNYTNWIKQLYDNTSISTPDLGKIIIDDMVKANTKDSEDGDDSILTMIDEGMIKVLYSTWTDFAYENTGELTTKNYSRAMKPKHGGRIHPKLLSRFGFDFSDYYSSSEEEYSLADYYEVDMMSAASEIGSEASEALKAAISSTLVYSAYTEGDSNLTGIAVSLPYGDSNAYSDMQTIFANIGMDSDYIAWLKQFVTAKGASTYHDYDDFDDSWTGWDDYEDDYDWSEWDKYDDTDYWIDELFGFDDYDYDDTYNNWYDDNSNSDDQYYDDYYYEDYGDGSFLDFLLELLG